MTEETIFDQWLRGDVKRSNQTYALCRLYELMNTFLFHQYEPTKVALDTIGTPFLRRLDNWVGSFDEDNKWAAFHSLRYFFFAGLAETEEMYRCAVANKLLPWIADQAELDIFADDLSDKIQEELNRSWICPLTDSLRINSLLHTTGLRSRPIRPDWYSLRVLACPGNIKAYTTKNNIKYLILFEDFVGSGGQCSDSIEFAANSFDGKIFFCPLVICDPGDDKVRGLVEKYNGRLTYSPLVLLSRDCLVQKDAHQGEPQSFTILREAMERGYKKMEVALNGDAFGHGEVGCLYSSYSNCPNNTPPIYHHSCPNWLNPIFPRERRV